MTSRQPSRHPVPRPARARRALPVLLAAGLLAGCGDDTTGPGGVESSLELVAGGDQRGLPGWELGEPVLLRVRDGSGRPAEGVRVTFEVVAGGGSVSQVTGVSNVEGRVSTEWRLGPGGRSQVLRASPVEGSGSLDVQATALDPEEADLVVVRGTLDALTGIVLVREGGFGLQVVASRPVQDTLLHVPPIGEGGTEVVAFGLGNRPLRAAPAWTPGVDTVEVHMEPPVPVDIDFHVLTGSFPQQMEVMNRQLLAMEDVWREEGFGLALGEITFEDRTDPPREVHVSSQGICSGLSPRDAVQINVVTSIDGGRYTGWGCWVGYVTMANGTESYPYLLAHELGHTFTLEHTATGLMYPSSPGTIVREGEIYRAHFHNQSVLNTIFGSQPPDLQRACHVGGPSPLCLPETLDLGTAAATLVAEGGEAAVAPAPPAARGPVDAVGDRPRSETGPGRRWP